MGREFQNGSWTQGTSDDGPTSGREYSQHRRAGQRWVNKRLPATSYQITGQQLKSVTPVWQTTGSQLGRRQAGCRRKRSIDAITVSGSVSWGRCSVEEMGSKSAHGNAAASRDPMANGIVGSSSPDPGTSMAMTRYCRAKRSNSGRQATSDSTYPCRKKRVASPAPARATRTWTSPARSHSACRVGCARQGRSTRNTAAERSTTMATHFSQDTGSPRRTPGTS